jgi:CRP/FNR family transcriptional regulator
MHLQEIKDILRESDLFRDLNEIHLDLVLMVCEEISYLSDEYIFHQDDPGDALYIIATGEVQIVLEPEGHRESPIPVTVLGPKSTFGEVILVEEGRRTASVRCMTDAHLIRITRERLLRLCRDYPEIGFHIMYRMAAELALKLHSSNLNIREQLFADIEDLQAEPPPGTPAA